MVLQVARGLRCKSVETIVVMPRGDPTLRTLLGQAGVAYRELDLVRPRMTWNPGAHLRFLVRFWPNVRDLRGLLRETHAQIVHTNGLMNLQAAIAARLEGVRLIWHLHDIRAPRTVRAVCLPVLHSWADAIAIVARAVGEFYFPDPARVAARLHLIYPPVDPGRFNVTVDGSAVRAELGLPPEAPVVGAVANLSPGKGIEYLLEAAPTIKQRYPTARFIAVGELLANRRAYWAPLVARARELGLAQDFIFTGARHDMPEVYRAMTVYAHPSESEACGSMAVLEASASGVPVVVTDVGGTREAVEHGVTGLLIRPRRPAEIAGAVIRLLESPALAQTMATAARARMVEKFALDACLREHLEMYHAALGEPPEQQPEREPPGGRRPD